MTKNAKIILDFIQMWSRL